MSFDNSMMKPVRDNKPHIQLIRGYWRVSSITHVKGKSRRNSLYREWDKSYQFAGRLNDMPVRVDWHHQNGSLVVHFCGGRSNHYYNYTYDAALLYATREVGMILRRELWLFGRTYYASWSKRSYVY